MPPGSADHLGLLAEALCHGYNDKRLNVGDPNFIDVPVQRLTDKAYAAELAERIRRGDQATLDRLPSATEARGTTHVSVCDQEGNAVSMTHTLGAPSGVIVQGTGFILNGCMGIFDPRPGRATSIAPGKSYTASMAPVIGLRDGELALVIGAPGGPYIPQAITQTISNMVDFAMPVLDAIAAPRIAVTRNRTIDVSNRIPRYVTTPLQASGYAINRSYQSYAFGGVHGIEIVGGAARGAADPGRDGMSLSV